MPYVTTYNFTLQENIMKTLRQLFAVIVLILTIALSSSAGDMHTTAPTPQPSPTPEAATGETTTGVDGDIHTGDTDEAAAGDAVVAGALSLLQGVLSLL
jgi:hypothetical protein